MSFGPVKVQRDLLQEAGDLALEDELDSLIEEEKNSENKDRCCS